MRPRVRPQPVWRLRVERVATAVSLAAIAVVLFFTVVDREAPYKVIAKPLEGRIHIGKDNDEASPVPAVSSAAPAGNSAAAESGASAERP